MKVVHLTHTDAGNGGARAAYRLHAGLRESGTRSEMFVASKDTQDPDVAEFNNLPTGVWSRLKHRFRRRRIQRAFEPYQDSRPERAEIFKDDRTPHPGEVLRQSPDPDLFNFHSVYGFIDHRTFFQTVSRPVVWTLHDMNAFTGGCQYTVRCRRFEDACGRCPQLGSDDENDLSRQVWSRKKTAYQHTSGQNRLHVVCPSEWMAEEARASTLLADVPVSVIPYGLDTNRFFPRDAEGVPAAFGIPDDHRIVLFVASDTRPRKGFDLLDNALSGLGAEKTTLLSVGGDEPELDSDLPHVHAGYVESDLLLSVFYSLADVFVIPSRQDNLPNTVLESMACGTPVVGFEVGGIPDMVRPGETGWLAKAENVRALRQSIEQALTNDEKRKRMGNRCRAVVEEEYTLETQAAAYKCIYEELLRENAGHA
ncbi:glycosyltransferase family 4 protein [Salinibacter ruber]|uniref:Glycosyltransferase involved in cell wall biosynthesis n=1 Tax=Salinibacter ruber TaxID=146919 RepID=A0A9X2ZTP8_9BACT|nr:glycosyltransferase family 4 protein [Salinibacter ruber]MCS3953316.1 glycosyltransferase involved in cell wall biosynthesis [Salinibacter ruber]